VQKHRPQVAILDDEAEFRRALTRLLKAHGFDVVAFVGGEELLAALPDRHFDCVLLDLHMSGMTGFDVLAAMRAMDAAPPVIVITAHDEPECTQRAIALDAFECQMKPVASPVLLGSIERACARGARGAPLAQR
jgi:two-component system, LuxR family, response regulator FixJ